MGMTPGSCATALATVLATVTGIGQIHTRRRIIRDEQALKTLMFVSAQNRINGWMISPAAANTTVTDRGPGHHGIGVAGGGNALTTFQFQIEGYFGIDDAAASEDTFRDLSWDVARTINSYGLLNIAGISHQLPADVEQFGYIMLAGFSLLHYARIGVGFRGRTQP